MHCTQKFRCLHILRYVGSPHTCCTDMFTDMLDIDSPTSGCPTPELSSLMPYMCCMCGEIRATGWRVSAAGLRAKGSSQHKTWHTKAGVGDKRSVAQSSDSAIRSQIIYHQIIFNASRAKHAHVPIQRHTIVDAHVNKAPLSPT